MSHIKRLLPMVIAALLCVVIAASSSSAHTIHRSPHLTVQQQIRYFQEVVRHDRQQIRQADNVFRFFEHHSRVLYSASTGRIAWHEISKWREIKKDHQWQLHWANVHLVALRRSLAPPVVPQTVPGHLALWRCIAGYPGARTDGTTGESGGSTTASNGSHFNVLQMTDPWYGINPIGMSAEAIIAKAEQEYDVPANHNQTWLEQQWGQTVGDCLQYA